MFQTKQIISLFLVCVALLSFLQRFLIRDKRKQSENYGRNLRLKRSSQMMHHAAIEYKVSCLLYFLYTKTCLFSWNKLREEEIKILFYYLWKDISCKNIKCSNVSIFYIRRTRLQTKHRRMISCLSLTVSLKRNSYISIRVWKSKTYVWLSLKKLVYIKKYLYFYIYKKKLVSLIFDMIR